MSKRLSPLNTKPRVPANTNNVAQMVRPESPAGGSAHALPRARILRTAFHRLEPRIFTGYAYDPSDLQQRLVVQLFVDGNPMQIAVANEFEPSLSSDGAGDTCFGFTFALPAGVAASATYVEARVANTGETIGQVVDLRQDPDLDRQLPALRGVRWIGGLRFCGWLPAIGPNAPKVTASIDGVAVVEAFARTWNQVGDRGEAIKAIPAFELHLPERFADGRVRSVCIRDETGEDLPGSPLTFVAFKDGLQNAIASLANVDSERLRGELFDQLIPASLPLSRYASWLERFPPETTRAETAGPVSVVLVGRGDDEASIASLQHQSRINWVAVGVSDAPDLLSFDGEDLFQFSVGDDGAASDVFVFAPCGVRLEGHALESFVAAFAANPEAVVAYADYAISGATGEQWPILLPAFDYERMLEQGSGACLFATRRAHLEKVLPARPDNLYRLFQELVGLGEHRSAVVHLPGSFGLLPELDASVASQVLASATAAHLDKRGIAAAVTVRPADASPSVRVSRHAEPQRVSVIIPTRNHAALLRRCLETIAPAVERLDAEVIVADNDSSDGETLEYLASIDGAEATVIRAPGPFNFSRINNLAARAAKGDLLCLLNNDVEALDDTWLAEMVSRIAEPDVGAVGATLLWPSGIIQHAGVVLGPGLGASHAFTDRMNDDPGYAGMLSVARECSAVTAACLLTRKADYLAVGGMDEMAFPVNFNDVDYCLRLRARGSRIVVTPDARLLHLESASRGTDQRSDKAARMQRELRMLRARWLETIVNDPYYSPLLSLDPIPYSALAWPPRHRAARTNGPPRAVEIPLGI